MTYTKKTISDFCVALQKAGIMKAGSNKNNKVITLIQEIVSLPQDEIDKNYSNNTNINLIYSEFSDWIETYDKKAS